MINSITEIEQRFDLIKDHKPKATKKLNEIADIIASAFKINPRVANEMWEYLIELNVNEDISNAKFYVAQVFKKLTERLSNKDVADLISLNPDRIILLMKHGYEGTNHWMCMDTLLRGFLDLSIPEDAFICVGLYCQKYGEISESNNVCTSAYRHAIDVAIHNISSGVNEEESKELIELVRKLELDSVSAYIEILEVLENYCESCDYDRVINLAMSYNYYTEFFELLWTVESKAGIEYVRNKWIEYVQKYSDCNNVICGRPSTHKDEESYIGSRLQLFSEIEIDSDILLNYYFSTPIGDIEKGVIWAWIESDNWGQFTKFISQQIMSLKAEQYGYSTIIKLLTDFAKACYLDENVDYIDGYGRSYKQLISGHQHEFSKALCEISANIIGYECHDDYHDFVKNYIQKKYNNLDMLNQYGFSEIADNGSCIDRLKKYIDEFKNSGQIMNDNSSIRYRNIMDDVRKLCWSDGKEKNTLYSMAQDEEISLFFFKMCPMEWIMRKDLITACIVRSDVNRAIELAAHMTKIDDYPDYDELNGWGRQNMLTLSYLIKEFEDEGNYILDGNFDDNYNIAKYIITMVFPYIPARARKEIESRVKLFLSNGDSFEDYISNLIEDVDIYVSSPKPRGYGSASSINRISMEIMECFRPLSEHKRLDVVVNIMKKIMLSGNGVVPVHFKTFMKVMSNGLLHGDLSKVYCEAPEIFDYWLASEEINERDIIEIDEILASEGDRKVYSAFRENVFTKYGIINEIDTLVSE